MKYLQDVVNLLEETRKERLAEVAELSPHFTLDQLRQIRQQIDDSYNEAIWAVWRKVNSANELLESLKSNGAKTTGPDQ